MLARALVILAVVAVFTLGMSYWFGAEVLAAVGLIIAQIKVVFARMMAISSRTILIWLKAQGLNFARVELAKRWFIKYLIPLLIGAALQRRIAEVVGRFKDKLLSRYSAMMDWYRDQPRALRFTLIGIAMFGTLGIALTSMSLWLLLFSVQLPIWILAAASTLWRMVLTGVQKGLFRTLAFMKLIRVMSFVQNRLPEAYLERLRRFNFRVARIVVRRRRMTVAQLRSQKDGWAMRWALLREYFRNRRPEGPTEEEFDSLHARRKAERQAHFIGPPCPEPQDAEPQPPEPPQSDTRS